jgi:hypothetical protein
MKSKQLAIMIAVAAVLSGAAYVLNKKDGATTSSGGGVGTKVIELPVNDVAGILVQSASGKLSLTKKDDVWTVDDRAGYPANFERVHGMLTKLWDLKTVQEVKVGPSQFARLELAEPLAGAGTKIDFKDKDGKVLGALLLGKKHMKEGGSGGFGGDGGFAVGRYVTQPGGSRVSLVSETLDDIDAKPEAWLARDFIKVETPSTVTLAGPTDAQKWKLTRENATAEWKLEGAKPEEKLDAAKTSLMGTALSAPSFADVLAPDAKPADTGLDKPTVITIETFDGFTYVLKAGKETNGNQPVLIEISTKLAKERTPGKDEKPEDKTRLDEEFKTKLKGLEDKLAAEKKFEGRPFLIAKTTLDGFVKDRTALLAPPPEPAPPAAAPSTASPAIGLPPGAPGGAAIPSVTTPPIAVPPVPKPTPSQPAANTPPRKPIEAVTPPVSAPPVPPVKPAQPASPAPTPAPPPKPATPPGEPPQPAPPPAPKP